MSDQAPKTFKQGASELAQLRHDSEVLRARLQAPAAAKVKESAKFTQATEDKNDLKRKADQASADLTTKRTKREELENKLAEAVAAEQAASAANTTTDASLKQTHDAEKNSQVAVSALDDELVGISDDTTRLKRDRFAAIQEVRDGLESSRMRFGRWIAKLHVTSGKALLFPLPVERTEMMFKSSTGNLFRAQDFLAYLANPEYFCNRVLVIANQCANDHQAAKTGTVKDANRNAILCAIEKSDIDRLSAVAQQRLHQLFDAEVTAETARLKALPHPPTGNYLNIAKTTISTNWATEHLLERTLPASNTPQAIEHLATEIRIESIVGSFLTKLFAQFTDAAAVAARGGGGSATVVQPQV